MTTQTHSMKFRKQRKFLLVLPVITLPFITMIFWALGGGSAGAEKVMESKTGLNTRLPDARLKDENSLNKMSFYERAALDSAKQRELMKLDPYYKLQVDPTEVIEDSAEQDKLETEEYFSKATAGNYSSNQGTGIKTMNDPNEERVYRKLAELNKALNTVSSENPVNGSSDKSSSINSPAEERDVAYEVSGMTSIEEDQVGNDPELEQLNSMLDKIMDIQHPQRVKEKIRESSLKSKRQVFPVTLNHLKYYVTDLENQDRTNDTVKRRLVSTDFYSLTEEEGEKENIQNALEAVVHETQIMVSGASIKLRTSNDIYIRGLLIPKGTFISGITSLLNERLQVSVQSILYNNSILPVNLTVYDRDGIEGIYIPGTVGNEIKNEATDQALQSLSAGTLYPTAASQAATAGIEAAKNLLSKKSKLIKVQVKAGYKVLLMNKDFIE